MTNNDNDTIKLDERLETVRNYKLKREKIEDYHKKLKELSEEPLIEELTLGGEFEVPTRNYLDKLFKLSLIATEMNLDLMKNAMALHIEHELDKEIQTTQMTEKLNQTLKQFGFDSNTFKRMFGSDFGTGSGSGSGDF